MNIECNEAAMGKHPNGSEVEPSNLVYNIIQVNQAKYHLTYS